MKPKVVPTKQLNSLVDANIEVSSFNKISYNYASTNFKSSLGCCTRV